MLKIKKDQLDEEFIYFSHVVNGVVAARRNKGSYLDNGVFRIEKDMTVEDMALCHFPFVFCKSVENPSKKYHYSQFGAPRLPRFVPHIPPTSYAGAHTAQQVAL